MILVPIVEPGVQSNAEHRPLDRIGSGGRGLAGISSTDLILAYENFYPHERREKIKKRKKK